MNPDIWMDGSFVPWNEACIHPLCHSMQRGATLFESIDCMEGVAGKPVVFRLKDHLDRFLNSADIVGMTLGYSHEELTRAVIETVARSGMKQCTIRPIAFYADPEFDIYPGSSRVSVVIGIGKKKPLKESIRLTVSRFRKIDQSSMPVKAKVSGNYIAPLIAKSEAIRAGFDDTILLDRDGFVAEGTTANVFIVENGTILTSPGDKILQGITRNTIMILCDRIGLPFRQEFFPPERLKAADEVFVSSSGVGVLPVIQVDSAVIGGGVPGSVSVRLRALYREVVTGVVPDRDRWLTVV